MSRGHRLLKKAAPSKARRVPKRLALLLSRELQHLEGVPATPKMLVTATRAPLRSVRRVLDELVAANIVERPYYGHYRLVHPVPSLKQDPGGVPGLHGIVLVAYDWPISGTLTLPTGSSGTLQATRPVGNFGDRWQATEGSFLEQLRVWSGRNVRIRWFPSRATMQVFVGADRNPLGFEEMVDFTGWLRAMCEPLDPGEKFWLRSLGLNVDYDGWQADGFTRIRLIHWKNAYRQLYQKFEDRMRLEMHINLPDGPQAISLKQGVEVMMDATPAGRVARTLEAMAKNEETRAEIEKLRRDAEEQLTAIKKGREELDTLRAQFEAQQTAARAPRPLPKLPEDVTSGFG